MTTIDIITNDNDAVVTEIEISAPSSREFQALTDRAQALQWGAANGFDTTQWEMDPRTSGQRRSVSKELKGAGAGKDFDHHGEILEIDAPRLLSYSCPIPGLRTGTRSPSPRTVVRFLEK